MLQVNDSFITDAVSAVNGVRAAQSLSYAAGETEKLIREYVSIGLNKLIGFDWSSTLSDSDQDKIVNKIANNTNIPFNTIFVDLEILENLASKGLVNPIVARPYAAEIKYEQDKAGETPAPSVIGGLTNQIGTALGNLVNGLLTGLQQATGIDFKVLIYVVIGIAALILFMRFRKT